MYRNKKLLNLAREAPCMHCGAADDTIVAAHSNQLRDGKAKSLKAHDYRISFLCYKCHTECDQGKNLSKQERIELWEESHRRTIGWLFEHGKINING